MAVTPDGATDGPPGRPRPPSPEAGGRPRVLMLLHWPRKGGAERLAVQLQEGLSRDFRVEVGFARPLPRREWTLEIRGAPVSLAQVLFEPWDVIHTHLFLPGLVARIRRLRDRRFRWVHTVHYHDYADLRMGRLKRWIDERIVYPRVDRLVAVSPTVRDALASAFPEVELVENAIPLDPVPAADRRPAGEDRTSPTDGGGAVVGTMAMLRAEKGLDDLVRAADALRDRRPGVRFVIAGEGGERPALEALVRERGLEEVVELRGFVEDTDAFYRSLDVYVQPSRSESFGIAALEALRYGLPLIVADAGRLPELTGSGAYGTVIERGRGFPEELAEAVASVLDDPGPHRVRARRGLEHWRARLDPERMEEAYRRIYRGD